MADAMFGFCKSNNNIPIAHLDYTYIRKCNDAKELESLLKILRSGEEGLFPNLIKFTEDRLESISPNSKLLQKETKVKMVNELQNDESTQLLDDLQEWSNKIKDVDKGLVDNTYQLEDKTDYPPIRQLNKSEQPKSQQNVTKEEAKTEKNVAPRSYSEWDKFNVENEVQKVDEVINKKPSDATRIHNKTNPIPAKVETSKDLSDGERDKKAAHEKEKGNEAFRAGDFKEALVYYNRSISLQQSAAVFNNRAITFIKMEKFEDAIADCETVLKLEATNVKAFLRRGVALKHLKRYERALEDFSIVMEMAPSNKRARELYEEVKKNVKEADKEQKHKTNEVPSDVVKESETRLDSSQGKKILIEEMSSCKEDGKSSDGKLENPTKKKGKRLKIIEVENTDDILSEKTESNRTDEGTVENTDNDLMQSDSKIQNKIIPDADMKLSMNEKDTTSEKLSHFVESKLCNSDQEDGMARDNEKSQGVNDTVDEKFACKENSDLRKAMDSTMMQNNATEGFQKSEQILPVPDDIIGIKNEGNMFYKAGQYAEAERKYSEAIDRLRENGKGHEHSIAVLLTNRATCKLKIGDCKSCVKDATESLEMRPSAKAFLRRAASYEHLENFRCSYADYQSALQLDNSLQAAWAATSRLSTLLKQRDGPRWRDHLPKTQSFSNLMLHEATYVKISDKDSETSTPTTVQNEQAVEPTDVKASKSFESEESERGLIEQRNENDMNGKEDIQKSKEKFKRIKDLGNQCVQKREYQDAIKYYSECIELFPDEVTCYTNRALCYLKLNQFENVEIDASKALTIQDDNVKALFRRALARKGLEKYKEAIEDLMALLEIENSNTAARKELSNIKEIMMKSSETKINIKEHAKEGEIDPLKSTEEIRKEAHSNLKPSKTEEGKQSELDGDREESGKDGKIDGKKEGVKKKKKLKIIEVDSYDEIDAVERNQEDECDEETACDGNKKKLKEDDAERNTDVKKEGKDKKININAKQRESCEPFLSSEGFPDDIMKMINEGDKHFEKGRYVDAIDCYTKALNVLGPGKKEWAASLAVLYGKKAACSSRIGDLKSSIEDATTSLKFKSSVSSYIIRASAYEHLEKYGNAYVDYMAALRIDSVKSAVDGCSRLMKVLRERDGNKWLEKLPKADEVDVQDKTCEATKVLKEGRKDGDTRKDGDRNSTEKQKYKKLESMEEKFNRMKELGNKCVQEGKYLDATSYYSQCIEFDGNEAISYVNRALCYLKLNKPKKAENDCSKALDLQPNNIKALFRRALARKADERYKDSLQDLTTLLKLDSKNTAAQKELEVVKELWREELKNMTTKNSDKSKESSVATDQKLKKRKPQHADIQAKSNTSENEVPRMTPKGQDQEEKFDQSTVKEKVQRPTRKLNLKKASGFEFLKAWNELKGRDLQEYANLLSQIDAYQLPKLISNKIDVEMILIIVSCVYEYFFTKDKLMLGFNILKYTSKSDRFTMGIMFLSTNDLSKVRRVVEELASKLKDFQMKVSSKDILELRKAYKAT